MFVELILRMEPSKGPILVGYRVASKYDAREEVTAIDKHLLRSIINYALKCFIVQAPDGNIIKPFSSSLTLLNNSLSV